MKLCLTLTLYLACFYQCVAQAAYDVVTSSKTYQEHTLLLYFTD